MADTMDYHIRLPVELVQRIDHLRIEQRTTRQELVARLLRRGLEAEERDLEPGWPA